MVFMRVIDIPHSRRRQGSRRWSAMVKIKKFKCQLLVFGVVWAGCRNMYVPYHVIYHYHTIRATLCGSLERQIWRETSRF